MATNSFFRPVLHGRWAVCSVLCLFVFFSTGRTQTAIRFNQQNCWADVMAAARQSNKVIFLSAHTSWSGPCELMVKKVFSDDKVAKFYNEHFINVKLDMEKGEGPYLAQKYNIRHFPSLVFIHPDGQTEHQVAGFYNPEDFVHLGQLALNRDLNMRALQSRYEMGDRSSGLLLALTEAYGAASFPATGYVAEQYLKTQEDWATPQVRDFIFRYVSDPFGVGIRYLHQHRAEFNRLFGEEDMNNKMEDVFDQYQRNHPELPLGEVQRLYSSVYPDRCERLASAYRLTYYQKRKNWKAFVACATDHYRQYPSEDAEEMGEMALLFLHHAESKSDLKTAEKWAERAVELLPVWSHYDTLSRLYALTGKKRQAISTAHRAIEIAQEAGESSVNTKAFLEVLRG
jgi:thioredoxin-related protein